MMHACYAHGVVAAVFVDGIFKADFVDRCIMPGPRDKNWKSWSTGEDDVKPFHLSFGPPLGDQRLDLCDLYAFQSPADKNRTVIILNANPNADALHPDAIYRLNVDS